jgi:hypothetical protein
MHSFQPSRGRILFEVLCVFALAASCVAAWQQTGAPALLAAGGVTALYGLVHLFDMRRIKPADMVEAQRIELEPEADIIVPIITAEEHAAVDRAAEQAETAGPVPARSGAGRRTGGSRKGSGRRTRTQKESKTAELSPVEEADVPWPMAEQGRPADAAPECEEELAFIADEMSPNPHIAPLFEPEPFVRMPRRAFGRRGRL